MTNRAKHFTHLIIWLMATGLCAVVLTLAGTFLYLNPQIPPAESYRNVKLETPLRIYSEDNALLAEFGTRRVVPVTWEEIPEQLIHAILDTEDKRFYSHNGIDLISLLNDALELAISQKISSGASTITMQLAKNVSFSREQTFIRKFKEMLLALKIEQALSKNEILTLYLNVVPFGKRAYGIQAASLTYYGKPLNELNLPQLAMLAGIPKAPEGGNPINGPERALKRRNVVLSLMLEQNSINRKAYQTAIEAPITARVHNRELDLNAPYIAEWVRQQLLEKYQDDLYTGGYEVFTTINAEFQAAAIAAVRKGLISYDRDHGYRGVEKHYAIQLPALEPEPNTTTDLISPDPSASGPPGPSASGPPDPSASGPPDPSAFGPFVPTKEEIFAPIVDILKAHPERGGLSAAMVIGLQEQSAALLLPDGTEQDLLWPGLSWARPYIDVDNRAARPKTAAEIMQVGDVIRIYRKEGEWTLGQLPEVQGALISMDPNTGKVKALVGGFDFRLNQFNHALQATRQPGSGLKPFVYSAAIANGITPADIFMDAPLVFKDSNLETIYRPKNDGGRYNGPTRVREALYRSINLVSMRILLKVGAGNVLEHVGKFGFDTRSFPRNTQLAIGGGTIEVTPMQMAKAYSILANEGYHIEPNVISEIRTLKDGTIFVANHPRVCEDCALTEPGIALPIETRALETEAINPPVLPEPETINDQELERAESEAKTTPPVIAAERAVNRGNIFIVNTMLQDVIRRGTGVRANRAFKRKDLSGKTGTTNEADTWFNGFNRDLVTSTWVGFSDARALGDGEYGSNRPLPIWIDYMLVALNGTAETSRQQPDDVVSLKIDPLTGEMARAGQSGAIFEYFLKDHPPRPNTGIRVPFDTEVEDQIAPEDIF